jgi:hypothetical protein
LNKNLVWQKVGENARFGRFVRLVWQKRVLAQKK